MSHWTSKLGNKYSREEINNLDAVHHRELQQLRKQPANAICAECGEGDTAWASVNLGVFLCVRCSDVHRALGTHISKPKGCSGTYLWGPDEIEQMKQIGNAIAAARYGGATAQTEPNATKERRLELCRRKYEQGSAVAPVVSKVPVLLPAAAPLQQWPEAAPQQQSQQCKLKTEFTDLIDLEDHAFWAGFGLSEKAEKPEPAFAATFGSTEVDWLGFDNLLHVDQQLPQSCAATAAAAALVPPPPGVVKRGDSASLWEDLPFASW